MLRSALDQHPDLYFETEVYLFARTPKRRDLVPEKFLQLLQDKPVRACVKLLKEGVGRRAAGFTLFYDQMRADNQLQLWRFLEKLPDLHVVELQRRNPFLQWLSIREALAYDQWALYPKDRPKWDQSIQLRAWEYTKWLKELHAFQDSAGHYLHSHPQLNIYYEDLQKDFHKETDRVLEFLSAPPARIDTMTGKMAAGSLASRISNIDEFEAKIKGSEGEVFFAEALRLDAAGEI